MPGLVIRCHVFKSSYFNTLRQRQNDRHFADDTFKRIFLSENVGISIKIFLKFVHKCPISNIPALVQMMAWCRPGDKPLYEPMVVKLPTHTCVTRPQWVNTLRPRQNGRHCADDIFKCILLNGNVWIPNKISLKFVAKGPINNIPSLVQIMAWRRPGDKPLSEPMMVSSLTHICVTRPQWVNSVLKTGGRLVCGLQISYRYLTHWDQDKTTLYRRYFQIHFSNENCCILIQISLNFFQWVPFPVIQHWLG